MRPLIVTVFGCMVAAAGFAVSAYSKFVSILKNADLNYDAFCDINEYISCSKILTSEYGYGFGFLQFIVGEDSILNLSNSVFGMVFYMVQFFGIMFNRRSFNIFLFWMSVISVIMCIYLAYILMYILYDFCIVCVTIYILNTILLVVNYLRTRPNNSRNNASKRKTK